MQYKGPEVYDNADFFRRYTEKRQKGNAPNDTLEKPIIDELIGHVKDKDILDIGCGDGTYGVELLDQGASFYHGIDGSTNMTQAARISLQNRPANIELSRIETFTFPADAYDLVLSRLVFHYIEQLESLFHAIYHSLRPGGQLVFSVEHPLVTSCYDAYHQDTKRGSWIVDHYFHPGARVNTWLGRDVVKYHRTLEEYFALCKKTGFAITTLKEAKPHRRYFTDVHEYERRRKIPLFLLLSLHKA